MASDPKKKQRIKQTLQATKARRKTQCCRVYELKLTKAKLSPKSQSHLERLFCEAKWFYNWIVSHDSVFDLETKVKAVPVKVGETLNTAPSRACRVK